MIPTQGSPVLQVVPLRDPSVDGVTPARAIGGTDADKYVELLCAANRYFTYEGGKGPGDVKQVFPDSAGHMGANCVEAAQACNPSDLRHLIVGQTAICSTAALEWP